MATNVTVLGASGATVTIPFTSDSNAAAAQSALYSISQLVSQNLLKQYQYPGKGGDVPPVTSPYLFGGLVVSANTTVNAVTPLTKYISVVSNSKSTVATTIPGVSLPGVTVTGGADQVTVASGTAGIAFLNISSDASIFLGGGRNFIYQRASTAQATINVDAGPNYVEAGQGATTINAFDGAQIVVQRGAISQGGVNIADGSGTVMLHGEAGSSSFMVNGGGGGGVATTLTGVAGANMTYYGVNHDSAFLNPGAGNITVVGDFNGDTTSTATLFGGTGTAHVYGGTGYFVGGTGGANELGSSTVQGATTLVGAHTGDVLYNAGKGNTLIAGAGAETLSGIQNPTAAGGSSFIMSGGETTVFGDASGGNRFYLGAGISMIDGDGAATTHSMANIYSSGQAGGTSIVFDFISGLDQFSTSYSIGAPTVSSLQYYAANSSSIFGAHSGTELILSDSTKVDFYNVQVKSSDIS